MTKKKTSTKNKKKGFTTQQRKGGVTQTKATHQQSEQPSPVATPAKGGKEVNNDVST